MAEVKNYGLSGVHRTLQLGKQGPVLVGNADTDSFSVTLQDAATLTNMSGANATSGTHFITKSQLDAVYTEATFLANVNYNDSSPILLGNISYGTKTIITTFEVTTAFDDPAAVVTVGDSSNNSLLMSDSYAEIEVTGTYQTVNVVEFENDSTLNIYVTQAGATQGAGTVLVSVVDGPVVNGGAINYGTGGGNAANVGEFVFTDTTLTVSGLTNEDMYVKAIDDLFLDALDDDVHLRANDDIRFRTGYDFGANTYTWELRYTDGGSAIFYNYTAGNDYGYIRPVDDAGSLGMSYEGLNDAYVKADYGNKTWKFASNGDLILPASGDIKNSSGTSVLGAGGISLADISVASNSPSGNGSLSYDNTTGVFTFTPAAVSGGNYGDSNVVTLLSSFGSNAISTTGNVTTGNVTTAAGRNVVLGNASSKLTQLGSNASIQLAGVVTLTPDTSASANNGVLIAGNGYLLGPNGSRNLTLNYSGNGGVGAQSNLSLGAGGGGGMLSVPGTLNTGISSIVAGVSNTLLPNTVASFSANVNNYVQVTLQNKSSGADATADFIITADNGSDTVNFADFGIINSGYDNTTPSNSLGNIVFAADTYLYAQGNASNISQPGGNLAIGTTTIGKTVKVFAGGANSNSVIGTFSSTGLAVAGTVSGTGNISTSGKFVGDGSALTNVTVSVAGNIVGTSQNVSLVAGSYTATFDNTGVLTLPAVGGSEGGEINFGIPTANTTLVDRVKLDVYQDRIRFFDGSTKGAYIDLSQAGSGVSTLLNNRVSGYVNAGTYLTMDNLKATVSTSGNRSLQIAAVSGSFAAYVSAAYTLFGGGVAGTGASITVTTTPALALNWNFTAQGDVATYIISDTTNSCAYRVTMMIGGSYNNNMISIERLI